MVSQRATLDLRALLETKAFDEEDLAQNRRGTLSEKQRAWCKENPRFVDLDDDDDDDAVMPIVGRVAVEGRHAIGRMGETTFPQLVADGGETSYSLPPGLKRALVRDAPYRAYAAHGWIWSIEPLAEHELGAPVVSAGPYRTAEPKSDDAAIARALRKALAKELSFDRADLKANRAGRLSAAQRARGRRLLLSATARLLIACIMIIGLLWMLASGAPFPVLGTILGVGGLTAALVTCAMSWADACRRALAKETRRAVARLDKDPTSSEHFVLESDARPLKIRRAALAVHEAPSSAFLGWRFEVHYVPQTREVITVRPLRPRGANGTS